MWRLSEFEPITQGYELRNGDTVVQGIVKPSISPIRQAQIIIKKKTLDELVDELNG